MDAFKEYYRILNTPVLQADGAGALVRAVLADRGTVCVSENRYVRKALKLLGKRTVTRGQAAAKARAFLPLYQLFGELRDRGVPCYLFGRPDMKEPARYSALARERMENGLSFPKMSEDYAAYKRHFDEILREKSSADYVFELRRIPQIIYRGGLYGHEDTQSALLHVAGGRRVVPDAPDAAERRIHVYGRCGAFGYAVEDGDALPSALQRRLHRAGWKAQVMNHGLWGADDDLILNNLIAECRAYTRDDIVVLYEQGIPVETVAFRRLGVRCYDCTEAFHADPRSAYCFYDRPGHMSGEGYDVVAGFVQATLEETGLAPGAADPGAPLPGADWIAACAEQKQKDRFEDNLRVYLDEIRQAHPLRPEERRIGAIIMNCNPFTLGHRYLIEYAAGEVNRLYVFVLQEDKSFFKFSDRLALVQKGTADLQNVIVLPSREFMISALTFPEYFMKEYQKTKEFDATQDLYTFGHFIAPALQISVRFAGEEPIDIVTRAYNEQMRRLLPGMGVVFCEIPRKTTDGGQIVSASEVRRLMREERWDEIRDFVPKTTYDWIIENYRDKPGGGEPCKRSN